MPVNVTVTVTVIRSRDSEYIDSSTPYGVAESGSCGASRIAELLMQTRWCGVPNLGRYIPSSSSSCPYGLTAVVDD